LRTKATEGGRVRENPPGTPRAEKHEGPLHESNFWEEAMGSV